MLFVLIPLAIGLALLATAIGMPFPWQAQLVAAEATYPEAVTLLRLTMGALSAFFLLIAALFYAAERSVVTVLEEAKDDVTEAHHRKLSRELPLLDTYGMPYPDDFSVNVIGRVIQNRNRSAYLTQLDLSFESDPVVVNPTFGKRACVPAEEPRLRRVK